MGHRQRDAMVLTHKMGDCGIGANLRMQKRPLGKILKNQNFIRMATRLFWPRAPERALPSVRHQVFLTDVQHPFRSSTKLMLRRSSAVSSTALAPLDAIHPRIERSPEAKYRSSCGASAAGQ